MIWNTRSNGKKFMSLNFSDLLSISQSDKFIVFCPEWLNVLSTDQILNHNFASALITDVQPKKQHCLLNVYNSQSAKITCSKNVRGLQNVKISSNNFFMKYSI